MPRAALEALSVEECVSHLDTDLVAGLTQAAAEKRRTEGRVDAAAGLRTPLPALVATVTSSLFARLLLGMALVNAAAAAAAWAGGAAGGEGLSAVLRETAAAAAFVCAPVVLALFVEGRLAACMERLQAEAPALCRVVRDGARKRVEAAELVAGDVLLCSEGDVVPADVRVVEVQAAPLRVDQSFLSGERFNVEKVCLCVCGPSFCLQLSPQFVECSGGNDDAATRAYAETMLYKGSAVTSGGTLCLVCRVGGDTDEAKKLKHHAASKAMRLMLQPSFLFGAFYANASASALYSDGKTGQANIKTQEAAGFSVYAGGCFRVERRISEYVLRFQTLALLFCLGLFVCRLPGSDGAFAVLGHLHAAVWLYAASVGWLPLVEPAIPVLAALVQTEQGAACVVRRPQALEQLGRVEAVCCDVSGVLTEGVPVARELRTLRSGGDGGAVLQELHVRGVGYNPVDRAGWTGKGCDSCVDPSCLIFDGRSSAPVANPLEGNKALADLALAAALCNTARLEYRQDLNRCVAASPEHRPSPARASDAALLCLVEKLGSTSHPRNMELLLIERPERRVAACLGVWRQQHRTARSAPPTAERRCHSTLAVGAAGSRAPSVLLTKGAADSVLPLCVAAVTGAGEEVAMTVLLRSALETEVAALESAGMAVIATARRPLEEEELPEDGDVSKCERGLVFTGLIGVADTSRPRPQAATAALGTAHVVYVSEDAAGSAVHHLKAAGVVPGDATVDDLRRSGKIATANEFENLPESERVCAGGKKRGFEYDMHTPTPHAHHSPLPHSVWRSSATPRLPRVSGSSRRCKGRGVSARPRAQACPTSTRFATPTSASRPPPPTAHPASTPSPTPPTLRSPTRRWAAWPTPSRAGAPSRARARATSSRPRRSPPSCFWRARSACPAHRPRRSPSSSSTRCSSCAPRGPPPRPRLPPPPSFRAGGRRRPCSSGRPSRRRRAACTPRVRRPGGAAAAAAAEQRRGSRSRCSSRWGRRCCRRGCRAASTPPGCARPALRRPSLRRGCSCCWACRVWRGSAGSLPRARVTRPSLSQPPLRRPA